MATYEIECSSDEEMSLADLAKQSAIPKTPTNVDCTPAATTSNIAITPATITSSATTSGNINITLAKKKSSTDSPSTLCKAPSRNSIIQKKSQINESIFPNTTKMLFREAVGGEVVDEVSSICVPENCGTLEEAVIQVTENDVLNTIVLSDGYHQVVNDKLGRVFISSPMTIIGAPVHSSSISTVLGGFEIARNVQGIVEIENITIQNKKGTGVLGESSFFLNNVSIKNCKYQGVVAHGSSTYGICTNVKVSECNQSGMVASNGATLTLIGLDTKSFNNCTGGRSNDYGLEVLYSSSSILLVSPLTKEKVSMNNNGDRNWGTFNGIVTNIKTVDDAAIPETLIVRTESRGEKSDIQLSHSPSKLTKSTDGMTGDEEVDYWKRKIAKLSQPVKFNKFMPSPSLSSSDSDSTLEKSISIERSELIHQIFLLRQELEKANARANSAESEVDRLKKESISIESSELNHQIIRLRQELEKVNSRAKSAESEVDRLKKDKGITEEKFRNLERDYNCLEEKLEKMGSQFSKEVQETKKKYDEDIENYKETLREAEKQITELKNDNDTLKNEVSAEREVDRLKKESISIESSELNHQIIRLRQELEKVNSRAKSAESEVDRLKKDKGITEEKFRNLERDYNCLEEKLEKMGSQFSKEVQETKKKYDEDIENYKETLREAEKQITELKNDNDKLKNEVLNCLFTINQMKKEMRIVSEKKEHLIEETKHLKTLLNAHNFLKSRRSSLEITGKLLNSFELSKLRVDLRNIQESKVPTTADGVKDNLPSSLQNALKNLNELNPCFATSEFQMKCIVADHARQKLKICKQNLQNFDKSSNGKKLRELIDERNISRNDLIVALKEVDAAFNGSDIVKEVRSVDATRDIMLIGIAALIDKFSENEAEWEVHYDTGDTPFYYSSRLDKSQWDPPLSSLLHDTGDESKMQAANTDLDISVGHQAPTLLSIKATQNTATTSIKIANDEVKKWIDHHDPTSIMQPTDAAIKAERDALHKLPEDPSKDTESKTFEEWKLANEKAVCEIVKEWKYWENIPLPSLSFPVKEVSKAFKHSLDYTLTIVKIWKSARKHVEMARDELAVLCTLQDSPEEYINTLQNLENQYYDCYAEFRTLELDLDLLKQRHSRRSSSNNDLQKKQEGILSQLNGKRVTLQRLQRSCESARTTLVSLATDHYPELVYNDAINLGTLSGEEAGLLTTGRRFQHYVPKKWPREDLCPDEYRLRLKCVEFNGVICVLKKYDITNVSARRCLLRTVRLMHALQHPNIAVMDAVFEEEDTGTAYVQMPLYNGGPLNAWLQRDENRAPMHTTLNCTIVQRTSERGMLRHVSSLHQLLLALNYVHCIHSSVHGDVKLENALVNSDGCVKLSDFDLSRDGGERNEEETKISMTTRAGAGTFTYMAPEVQRNGRATMASDVYSFGVCVLQAFVPNAKAMHDYSTLARIIPPCIEDVEPELYSLLQMTLCAVPGERATTTKLLEHDFFKVDAVIKELKELKDKAEAEASALERKKKEDQRKCSICYQAEEKQQNQVDLHVEEALVFLQKDNNIKRCRAFLCGKGLTQGKAFAIVNKAKVQMQRRSEDDGKQCAEMEELAGVFDVSKGVECHARDNRHFLCDNCLVLTVKDSVELVISGQKKKSRIVCVKRGCSAPYSDHSLAKHLSRENFDIFQSAKMKIHEKHVVKEMEKGFEERLKAIASLSEFEKHLDAHKEHVIERILNLSCPRCQSVFDEFDGCFALKCSKWIKDDPNSCCQFCAYCFWATDPGGNAHPHVSELSCPGNIEGLFPGKTAERKLIFEKVQRERRKTLLKKYLAGIQNTNEKDQLVVEINTYLRDHGLRPEDFVNHD